MQGRKKAHIAHQDSRQLRQGKNRQTRRQALLPLNQIIKTEEERRIGRIPSSADANKQRARLRSILPAGRMSQLLCAGGRRLSRNSTATHHGSTTSADSKRPCGCLTFSKPTYSNSKCPQAAFGGKRVGNSSQEPAPD